VISRAPRDGRALRGAPSSPFAVQQLDQQKARRDGVIPCLAPNLPSEISRWANTIAAKLVFSAAC